MQLGQPRCASYKGKGSLLEESLPIRNTHALNTPKDEDTMVPDNDRGSRNFLEQVTWFVSSLYAAFGKRTGNKFQQTVSGVPHMQIQTTFQRRNHGQQGGVEHITVVVDARGINIQYPHEFPRLYTERFCGKHVRARQWR